MTREFIITSIFDKNWKNYTLTDLDLVELEHTLLNQPNIGNIIEGTGGLRKLRFALPNRGKSGSIRILYIDFMSYEKIILVNCYSKNEKDNISDKEKSMYKTFIKSIEQELKGV